MSMDSKKPFPFIGKRLEVERERLHLTQEAAGGVAGATRETWKNWMTGKTYPNAMHLSLLGGAGFDVSFIIRGVTHEARQDRAEYGTPARDLAEKVAAMKLSTEDAELILDLAHRLNQSK